MRLVDETDVLRRAVVALEILNIVLLDFARFLDDALVCIRDVLREKSLPLRIGKRIVVEPFELRAQIACERVGIANLEIGIALPAEQMNELRFERRLALIAVGARADRLVLRDDRALLLREDDVVCAHMLCSLYIRFSSFRRTSTVYPDSIRIAFAAPQSQRAVPP